MIDPLIENGEIMIGSVKKRREAEINQKIVQIEAHISRLTEDLNLKIAFHESEKALSEVQLKNELSNLEIQRKELLAGLVSGTGTRDDD